MPRDLPAHTVTRPNDFSTPAPLCPTVQAGMVADTEPTVASLAGEILQYLNDHPLQADTDAHIARWWLLQSRVERALGQVQAALQYLESAGQIERGPSGVVRLPGGPQISPDGEAG